MEKTRRRTFAIGAGILVCVLSVFIIACGGGDSSTAVDSSAEEALHVEGDEHGVDTMDMEGDTHEADEMDMEGNEHEADAVVEENAYLEVAPKDALYLIRMTNFAFTPDVLEVNAGDVLEIAIQNVEPVLHDFTIDKIGADVHISYLGGTGQHAHAEAERNADVHFALTEPGSGVVHLRAYEPGEYVFYCSVPGHREAGMEGTLIVR